MAASSGTVHALMDVVLPDGLAVGLTGILGSTVTMDAVSYTHLDVYKRQVQGIGMALYENVQYDKKGHMMNNSFMQYKIPTRLDMGRLRVEFESSYEPVSYTHLDVYKRQVHQQPGGGGPGHRSWSPDPV